MQGYKSANEKFAGSMYSSSIEGFVPVTGRGIQAGTSHALGQNFSKMFGIEYEAQDKTSQLAWQTSWGLSTRSIGVMIMVHGDDKVAAPPPTFPSYYPQKSGSERFLNFSLVFQRMLHTHSSQEPRPLLSFYNAIGSRFANTAL